MVVTGPITLGTAGIRTFNLGIAPTWVTFRVCQKSGTTETFVHLSFGETDGFAQQVSSVFYDATGGKSINSTSKVISHYERVSGTLTEVLAASFDSFTASGLKLNVTTANANYQVFVTAGT